MALTFARGIEAPRRPAALAALSAVLCAVSFALLLRGAARPPAIYDEGLFLTGSSRVLAGEMPYRDFWNTQTPAQIYAGATLFAAFGESVAVGRRYDLAVRSLVPLALFHVCLTMVTLPAALAVWAFATLWLGVRELPFGYTAYPALLWSYLALLALLASLRGKHGPSRLGLFAAGSAAGICLLFRQDFGLYTTVAALATLAFASWPSRPGELARRAIVLLAGALAPVLPAFAALLLAGTPVERLHEVLVHYPAAIFPAFRRLPIPAPTLANAAFYLPVPIALAGLLVAFAARGASPLRERFAPTLFGLSAVALAALPQAATRSDLPHQIPLVLPSLALLLGMLRWLRWRLPRTALAAAAASAAAGLLLLAHPLRGLASAESVPGRGNAMTLEHGVERARGIPLDPDEARMAREIREATGPEERIYVGLGRHDKVFANDALLYFLAGRRPGTYYHNLPPGQVTTRAVQRGIVEELVRGEVRCAVLYTGLDDAREPNLSAVAGPAHLLDRFLERNFRVASSSGSYRRLSRAGGEPPSPPGDGR